MTPRNTKVFGGGSIVTLDCAANGVPKPFITWLKDGETIDLNLFDTRFSKVGQGSLQIKEVTVDDQGTYQCRAENSEDSVDAAAILEVLVAPRYTYLTFKDKQFKTHFLIELNQLKRYRKIFN